jgi:hypothetical protein
MRPIPRLVSIALSLVGLASCAPTSPATRVAWGFDSQTDGFSFGNFASAEGELTAVEMRRLFGPGVCQGASASGDCLLVPAAEQWMTYANSTMAGGHCEGFVALSALLYTGALRAADLGAPTASALSIEGNTALRRELALWQSTQIALPALERTTLTPQAIVDELASRFAQGRAYRGAALGLYLPGARAAHAVLPIAVQTSNDGGATITVVDFSAPGAARDRVREISLSPSGAGLRWRYETAGATVYQGDSQSFTMTLADIAPRASLPLPCPFCDSTSNDMQAVSGDAQMTVTDAMGRSSGRDAMGREVNEIPGVELRRVRSVELSADSPMPVLGWLVDRPNLAIRTGLSSGWPAPFLFSGQRDGFSFYIQGIILQRDERDFVTPPTTAEPTLTHLTTSASDPLYHFAFVDGADSYTIRVQWSGLRGPMSNARIHANRATGLIRAAHQLVNGTMQFTMHRDNARGRQTFTSGNVQNRPSIQFNYRNWPGQGQPLQAESDADGDGTFEQSFTLADSE